MVFQLKTLLAFFRNLTKLKRSGHFPLTALTWALITINQSLYNTLQNVQSGYSCYSVNAPIPSSNCKFMDREKNSFLVWTVFFHGELIICIFSYSCRCVCWGGDGNSEDCFIPVTNTLLYTHMDWAQLANHFCLYFTSWDVCIFSLN